MKVYWIPNSKCPLRIQVSDDGQAAAIQCRGEDDVSFYWLTISAELSRIIILDHGMKVLYELPDTPESQIR